MACWMNLGLKLSTKEVGQWFNPMNLAWGNAILDEPRKVE
jgi:hypothetical protein